MDLFSRKHEGEEITIRAFCHDCQRFHDIPESAIIAGGSMSKYAYHCPSCGHVELLNPDTVEKFFGSIAC